jgi:hypothetical protein
MKLSAYQMLDAFEAGDWTAAVRLVKDEFSLSLASVVAEIRRLLRTGSFRWRRTAQILIYQDVPSGVPMLCLAKF